MHCAIKLLSLFDEILRVYNKLFKYESIRAEYPLKTDGHCPLLHHFRSCIINNYRHDKAQNNFNVLITTERLDENNQRVNAVHEASYRQELSLKMIDVSIGKESSLYDE